MRSSMEYKPQTEVLPEQLSESGYSDSDVCRDEKHMPIFVDPDYIQPSAPVRDILDFGDEGFLLEKTLSDKECDYYIQQAERLGFDKIPEARKSYRNSERILLRSTDLASLLWARVRPFLKDIVISGDPHDFHIHGVPTLLQGTWTPLKLNDLFRLCRYEMSGHLGPHFDGHLVMSADVRSMKVCMVYLNGNFEGGSTNFVDEAQILYMNEEGRYCAEEKNILCRLQPEAGLTVIFNHHRLHEGEVLRSGVKYILRTDVMYKRVEGPTLREEETEALRLAQEAERLEASGDCLKAMELYRKAFKMSPSLAESYGCPS